MRRLIVVATEEEAKYIFEKYDFVEKYKVNGYTVYVLQFADGEVIGFSVLGIAKVTFCLGIQILIDNFRPKEIVSLGFAGGLSDDMAINDICVGISSFQYDIISSYHKNIDVDSLAYRRKKIYNANRSFINTILTQLSDFVLKDSIVLTGDNFISDKGVLPPVDETVHYIVDQETAAFYQAAYYANIDYIAIKIVTDLCNSNSKEEYKNNIDAVAMLLFQIFEKLVMAK